MKIQLLVLALLLVNSLCLLRKRTLRMKTNEDPSFDSHFF